MARKPESIAHFSPLVALESPTLTRTLEPTLGSIDPQKPKLVGTEYREASRGTRNPICLALATRKGR